MNKKHIKQGDEKLLPVYCTHISKNSSTNSYLIAA